MYGCLDKSGNAQQQLVQSGFDSSIVDLVCLICDFLFSHNHKLLYFSFLLQCLIICYIMNNINELRLCVNALKLTSFVISVSTLFLI